MRPTTTDEPKARGGATVTCTFAPSTPAACSAADSSFSPHTIGMSDGALDAAAGCDGAAACGGAEDISPHGDVHTRAPWTASSMASSKSKASSCCLFAIVPERHVSSLCCRGLLGGCVGFQFLRVSCFETVGTMEPRSLRSPDERATDLGFRRIHRVRRRSPPPYTSHLRLPTHARCLPTQCWPMHNLSKQLAC